VSISEKKNYYQSLKSIRWMVAKYGNVVDLSTTTTLLAWFLEPQHNILFYLHDSGASLPFGHQFDLSLNNSTIIGDRNSS